MKVTANSGSCFVKRRQTSESVKPGRTCCAGQCSILSSIVRMLHETLLGPGHFACPVPLLSLPKGARQLSSSYSKGCWLPRAPATHSHLSSPPLVTRWYCAGSIPAWGTPGRMPSAGQYCFESPQVAHYQAAQHFLSHEDAFPAELAQQNGFQRHATVLIYLNDVAEVGGAPQCAAGCLLRAFSCAASHTAEQQLQHAALAVRLGLSILRLMRLAALHCLNSRLCCLPSSSCNPHCPRKNSCSAQRWLGCCGIQVLAPGTLAMCWH